MDLIKHTKQDYYHWLIGYERLKAPLELASVFLPIPDGLSLKKKNSIVSWEYKMLLRGGVIWLESCVCVCVDVLMPTGFPGGSEVKASACNAGDLGSIPGSGRYPGEGNGNPPMEQQTGSKLVKEYVKAVCCHPAYLTSMQSTS